MKRILISALLLVIVLGVAVTPILAEDPAVAPDWGRGSRTNRPFTLVGTVVSVDAGQAIFTVHVLRGNQVVRSHVGSDLTIDANDHTRFYRFGGRRRPITLADLQAGDNVSVSGVCQLCALPSSGPAIQHPTRTPTQYATPTERPTRAPTQHPTERPTRTPIPRPTERPTRTPMPVPTIPTASTWIAQSVVVGIPVTRTNPGPSIDDLP